MTLRKKLLLNFLLVAAIVLICSIFGIWSIRKINASLEYVTARAWSAANAAMQTSIDNLTRIVATEEYLKGDREQARLLIRRAEERFNAKFEQLRKSFLADEMVLSNIKELWNKLTSLESKTLTNYHLRNRTKLQLDENALIWTKSLEKLRHRLALSRGTNPSQVREAENTLVSIGLLSLAERAAVNNYLAGSIREEEIPTLIEGFRSNNRRKIADLSKNSSAPPQDSKSISTIYLESERLTDKLLSAHREYRINQSELSHNTLRLVEAFENIKESMNENMEKAASAGRSLASGSQRYFAILAFLAFFLAIVIGVSITRRITQPIHVLTDATQAIAKGDLAHRVDVTTNDEIGLLSRSFNRMADDIHRYTEEIRQKSLQAELANQELQVTNKELYEALGELEKQSVVLKETNKELEKATRLKSQFLANMSHELRTPMNSIIGFTKLVLRKSEQTLDPKQKENLSKVLISADQLLALINSILDLSKIEAGHMEVYIEPFVMSEMMEQIKQVVWPLVTERGLKFVTKIDSSLPRIYSDPEKVKQILMNLISNAIKFTEKGEVAVSINRTLATLKGYPSTDCMEILVRDTGIGMPLRTQNIIFEDFRQADGSATRKYGGTGLGLSICKRLCDLLGGYVELVESHVGKGSAFRVLLPIDYEIEKRIMKEAQTKPVSKVKFSKILAIDDKPKVLDLLREKFSGQNVHVLVANECQKGYETARNELPELILIDVMMPNHRWWDLINQLKSDSLTARIPIIAISVLENEKIANPLGVDDYLAKPLDREILTKTISRHLGSPPKNILVVDDDPLVHESCSQYLAQRGFTLRCANNGEEALGLLNEFSPDLVLLDLIMPVASGFDFLEFIPKSIKQRNVPILVLASRDLSGDEYKFLEKNMALAIKKDGAKLEDVSRQIDKILTPAPTKVANLF